MRDLCGEEADWMADAAEQLEGRLDRLRSISTGAFLGGQPEIWKEIYLYKPSPENPNRPYLIDPRRLGAARYAISDLALSPHLASYCQHSEFGPLVFGPGIFYR